MIRFAIKSTFWLFVLLVGLTFFMPMPDDDTHYRQDYSSLDALFAFKSTVADLGSFCERNGQTCETGRSFFGSLGARARDGAWMLYQFLDRQFDSGEQQASTPLTEQESTLAR